MKSASGASTNCIAVWTAATILALTSSELSLAQQPPKNFATLDAAKPVAAVEFEDAPGHLRSLADLKGRVVLLNIWATWCIPCRKEMPALDRLQESLGGRDFEVVPLSIDRGGLEVVRKFYEDVGIRHLAMYVDISGQAYRRLSVVGLPTTFLIDRSGLEVGLFIGPAEWDSPEIAEFLKPIIANRDAPAKRADQDDQGRPISDDADAPGPLARGLQWLRAFLNR